ncbi:MAG: hypothetical protein ACOX4U_01300 [Anaerovoracaceae bacterium]|jgi:hypothetical protein
MDSSSHKGNESNLNPVPGDIPLRTAIKPFGLPLFTYIVFG